MNVTSITRLETGQEVANLNNSKELPDGKGRSWRLDEPIVLDGGTTLLFGALEATRGSQPTKSIDGFHCALTHPMGLNSTLLLPDLAFGAALQAFDVFAMRVEQQQRQHGKKRGERRMAEEPQEDRRDETGDQR